MKQPVYSLAILVLSVALAMLVAFPPKPRKCDCSGGTIFVIDSMDQLTINRRANMLLVQGDSTTGYLLKKVLMSNQ